MKRPYNPLGPAPSNSRHDAQPLVPGKPAELKFCMWPTSVLLRKGHQIRVAIAGADAGVFRRCPAVGDVSIDPVLLGKQASVRNPIDLLRIVPRITGSWERITGERFSSSRVQGVAKQTVE
jgi:uncharacterized protein